MRSHARFLSCIRLFLFLVYSLAIGRPRRPSLPPASPCLSRRYLQGSDISSSPPSTSPPHPTPPTRTLPQITHVPASHTSPTIPLRPCCQACYHSVDSAIALGEEWKEHWSPGALRRHHEKQTCLFGITRVWKPKGPDVGLEKALIGGLKVDEVDGRCLKKRVASEESEGGEDVNEEMMTSLTLDEPVPEEPEEEEQPLFPSSHYLPQTSPIPISIPEPKPPSYILDPTLPDPDMLLPPPPPTSTPSYPRQRSASTSPTRHRDRSASHSSVGSGAGTPMQNRRRPSVSESFIRGSTSIFKNVTAGITGAGMLR